MKHRSKRSEHNSIVQEFAVEAIPARHDRGRIQRRLRGSVHKKRQHGFGTRFKGSESDLLRRELYGLAKKKRRWW